jgi:hemoglobin
MTLFEALGGESALRALVNAFYWRMLDAPEYRYLRELHPTDISNAQERLFKYLTGWTGGPPLFVQEFGHPMLRARHLHVAIDRKGRDQWLACMQEALQETIVDAPLREQLYAALAPLADHMRNVHES